MKSLDVKLIKDGVLEPQRICHRPASFCLAQFPSAQKIVTHCEQCRAHPFEAAQIGIDGTQLFTQLWLAETVLNPCGEIAFLVFQTMSRFEDMEIDGAYFDLGQRVPKFLERPDFHTGRDLKNEGLIEVERFAENHPRDDGRLRQMVVDHRNELVPECIKLRELEWIDHR